MTNPADHNSSWNPSGAPSGQPSSQDPFGDQNGAQQYGNQNPYAPAGDSSSAAQSSSQDPFGSASSAPYTPSSQDPYAPASAGDAAAPSASNDPYASATASNDPYGSAAPSTNSSYGQPSASDPYGQAPAGGAPYGQPSASDPYGQAPAGAAPYGQQNTGSGGWSPANNQQASVPAGTPGAGPSRMLVGLMGIFFGSVGVHRFMLGYTAIGIIQIVVTFCTCGLGAWWGFIEGILVLAKHSSFTHDAQGRPLTD